MLIAACKIWSPEPEILDTELKFIQQLDALAIDYSDNHSQAIIIVQFFILGGEGK